MSEPMTHAAAAAGSPKFTELWRSVSKLYHSKTQDRKTGRQMPGCATPPMYKGEAAARSAWHNYLKN